MKLKEGQSKDINNKNIKIQRKETRRNLRDKIRLKRLERMNKNINDNQIGFSLSHLDILNDITLRQNIKQWLLEETDLNKKDVYLSETMSDDVSNNHHGMIMFRKIICSKELDFQYYFDHSLPSKFMMFAKQNQYLHLKLESIWNLSNLLFYTQNQAILIKKGVIKIFIENLNTSYDQILDQVLWGIGNISGESFGNRNRILDTDVCQILGEIYISNKNEKIR